ncbi:trichodiene oxygenase [Fusarium phyllophilum]|uniref:Trichodiene oxygenase n=1 Tax=Fusarium phyllophilum TaxID=47803 RepID=A0A8H5K6T9_9HYPO|nr:trichodiene oxygenase [Fusarium phyllophilum]
MKSYIVATTLLGSAGMASAAEYPSIVMDTWCITYLSTYLAPISALPGLPPSRQLTFFGNSSTAMATVSNTYDQSLIASESVTAFGLTTLDKSPTQAQSDPEAPSSGPISGSLTDIIITPSLSTTEITSSALATSTGIVEPRGRSVIFLVQASSNQERGIKKRDIGGFVGAGNPKICTSALTFNLGDGQLFVGGLPTFYADEDYKALGVQEENSFVQGAITRTFGISGRTLVFRNSGLPNGEAGFCQDSSGQVYIKFTASPPGCIPVTLDVYDTTQCQNGRLVGSETSTSTLAISTEARMAETSTAKTGMAENVNSGVFGSGEPTTAEATAFTEVSSLSSSEPSGTFSESSGSKALTTTSSQIFDTSAFASSPIFGSVLSTVSSRIDETSTSASPSVSGTTVFPQAISSSASSTFCFGASTTVSSQIDDTSTPATSSVSVTGTLSTISLQAISSSAPTSDFGTSTIFSTQIVDTSAPVSWQTQTQTFGLVTSTVISSRLVESFVTIESSIFSSESSTEATSSTKASPSSEASSSDASSSTEVLSSIEALSPTEQGGSNLLTTTSNEAADTSSPTFGSSSETSSQPASSDISDTSSSAEETTSYSSTTISESSTVITTITTETSTTITEASTTTTELMTSTTISEPSTVITTTTTEASTTTTEIMTTTTTAAPQSECQSASSPYAVQGVDFDLSCDGIITGGTSVGVAPASDFNQPLPSVQFLLTLIFILQILDSMEQKSVLPPANITAAAAFQTIAYQFVIWLAYRMLLAAYDISPLHPLNRFPGPKVAAASYLYEAYYDWWRNLGPIVRINPDELHCSDPYFTDEIYAGPGRIRNKWQHQLNTGGAGPVSVTGFSTVNHEIHRMRKGALSKYFSRQQMLKLEGEVKEFAQMTVDKMLRYAGGEPFDVKEAFNCFTADIMSQYAFGESMGFIAQDGWKPNLATWVKSFFQSAYMMRHNVFARKMAQLLPFLSDYLGEDIKAVMRQMNVVIPGYIAAALKNPEGGRVFADVMDSKSLPESEKSMYRLSGEGFNFLLAGTETTAAILTVITYYLLAQPLTYKRLMADLEGVDLQTLKWTELEQRPYLWAVIHEALRVMPGVSHRSARIAREEDLVYKSKDGNVEWVIPRGTPIGMTSMINHWDKEIFPNPDEFTPERWLDGGKPNFKLQKLLIAFGKGSRACIGEK